MSPGRPARLLFPALRWDPRSGFDHEEPRIEQALRRGVGGFIIFGGTVGAVVELTYRTQSRSDLALLFGSDLERGAGQQFTGATALPPLAAFGHLDDLAVTRRAADTTSREAMALGVNWLLAPVADVDLEPENPIVGTRAFGAEPERVAAHVAAWVGAARAAGAIPCAKHFPGHGRTRQDSHAALPTVDAARAELELDLLPFRAAIAAGVDTVMTAHVRYPALDAERPATLSEPILTELLRFELAFQGVIATDAVMMQGLLDAVAGDEAAAVLAAVRAGCDAVLYPEDLERAADALTAEIGRSLPRARAEQALERVSELAERRPPAWGFERSAQAASWAAEQAVRSLVRVRGQPRCPPGFELLVIDDDLGGPYLSPPREAFAAELHELGLHHVPVRAVGGALPLVIALFSDIRAWKGRPGLSAAARAALEGALARRRDALVVLFGHPRLAEAIPAESVLAAWGGEAVMQHAAARWLQRHAARTFL